MRKLLVAFGGLFLCLAANAQNVAIGSLTAQGVDCTTAGACITLAFEANDVASASIQLSGTFTATVQFEASSDKGTTWVAISGTPLNSSTAVTSATTANTWKFNVASITNIRARASAWTSAPTVVIRSSRAVANAIGGGGAVFASGGTTNNVIPKSNGSSQLADSSCTDNATNVACTEPIVIPASNAVANLAMSGNTTSGLGMSHGASGPIIWTIEAGARRAFSFDASANTLTMSSGVPVCWNSSATDPGGTGCDTGLSRKSAAVTGFGTGAFASVAGFFKSAQTLQVTAANYTTSATTLATAGVITGLSFTAPVSSAYNFSYRCDLVYSQATAAAANLWGITTSGTAPTSMLAAGEVYTSLAGANTDGTAVITTATSTTVVTATPSAVGAIGTTADMFTAHIWGTVEAPSNATPTTFGIAAASGNASDALTIYRGSSCWVY